VEVDKSGTDEVTLGVDLRLSLRIHLAHRRDNAAIYGQVSSERL